MGLSIPQYFNEYTAVKGYGPVHTGARWVFPLNPSNCLDLDTQYTKTAAFFTQTTYKENHFEPKKDDNSAVRSRGKCKTNQQ